MYLIFLVEIYIRLKTFSMRKIIEHGIQNREVTRIYASKPICHNKGSNFVSVGLRDSYFPFFIIIGGVGMSVFLLLMELATWNYFQRHKCTVARKLSSNG